MGDLPPHSTFYNDTYDQENQQTNDDVLDKVLTMTVRLSYDTEMLRSLKALCKHTDRFLTIFSLVDASSRLNRKRLANFCRILTRERGGGGREREMWVYIYSVCVCARA